MSAHGGPDEVTSGLVLALDAADIKSYPRTGTVWYDRSGLGNNGTLVNSPTFDSDKGGSLVLNGSTSLVQLANTVYNPSTTGSVSLDMWVYFTGPFTSYLSEPPTTNLGGIFGQGYFGLYAGYGFGIAVSNSNYYAGFQVRNFSTIVQHPIGANTQIFLNRWYNITGSFSRTVSNLFFNGQLVSSVSSSALNNISIDPSGGTSFRIGANNVPFYAGCKFASGKVYNRALSPEEVLQNYNANKSRFGLS